MKLYWEHSSYDIDQLSQSNYTHKMQKTIVIIVNNDYKEKNYINAMLLNLKQPVIQET